MENKTCEVCHAEKSPRQFMGVSGTVCRTCIRKAGPSKDPIKAAKRARNAEVKQKAKEILARKEAGYKKASEKLKKAHQAKILAQVASGLNEPTEQIIVDPIAKELASRVLARRRLIEFIKQFYPKYKDGWVHHDICTRLEQFARDVDAGLNPRLMLLMPPRHGKSQIASQMYPAWHLGHYPQHEFIACSYNLPLALKFSRSVRSLLRSEKYKKLFDQTIIDDDNQAAEEWKLLPKKGTIEAGGYVAAGIGGGITGKGAHVLVIDDPIKNAEEADSPEIREKIWDWYVSTAYSRLAPGGGVLVIQTCWHDDDLAGRLQASMKEDPESDRFEIVKYPAIAEEDEPYRKKGEALHPERYTLEALLRIKRAQGWRFWSALYQQDPVPNEGAYFTKNMFVYRSETPDPNKMHIYQAWDFAISEKKHNDWNVGVTVGVDYDDTVHVLEVRRFKTSDSLEIVNQMLAMYNNYQRVQILGAEDGQIWRTMKSLFDKRCRELSVYPVVEVLKAITDKQVRARPLQGRMMQRKVTFPPSAPWNEDVIKEMLRFPSGVHDDCVDALAWAITVLLGRAAPARQKYKGPKTELTLEQKLRKIGRSGSNRSHMEA